MGGGGGPNLQNWIWEIIFFSRLKPEGEQKEKKKIKMISVMKFSGIFPIFPCFRTKRFFFSRTQSIQKLWSDEFLKLLTLALSLDWFEHLNEEPF